LTQTVLAFGFVLYFSLIAVAQTGNIPARVTQPVDPEHLITLRGNTHPLARPEFDQGAAPDSQSVERILLVLQRSPEQETALRSLLDAQQIKSSLNYHLWLTPQQFGQQFGPADADIQAVTGWLTSQGFQVSNVAAGRTVIEFSGTAGQVRQALHTEIHKFVVNGEEHWANASDPQIPAALAPVVAGFASLNNFPRRPNLRRLGTFSKSKATGTITPLFTYPFESGYLLGVGPGDFATIYNVSPLYSASVSGTGQTIAIVAQTNINMQDVRDFRSMFGLPANDPQIILNGPDPGILEASGDEGESDLDVQWSGAIAPSATIDLVVSESTEVTAGVDLSALYIIDNNLAPVMSESYGECEAFLGSSGLQFYNILWEQGAAQGITIVEAAGDSGSAGCDSLAATGYPAAIDGLAVEGNASTPFNVAVGGTDFNDLSDWQTYWNYSASGSVYPSAKSYIPEMTWNDTCASSGSLSGCAAGVSSEGQDLVAGSGGPSNCAYPTISGESITCNVNSSGIYGIPKPAWQSGSGVPNDQVRDTPDVSLFAGDGMNGSFYIFCEMDANAPSGSSTSCDLNAPYTDFQGAGGTSASAQAFGAIMALVNQKNGPQGNANYVLYPLAAKSASCPASASSVGNTSCTFYDVQNGNNSVACEAGSYNCSNQTSGYGILVVPSPSAYIPPYTATTPAWPTSAGYDLATGLGTVNAANLVNNWTSVSFMPTTTKLTITPTTLTHGQQANFTVNVSPTSAAGDVSLIGGPSNSNLGIGYVSMTNGTVSSSTILLPGGSYGVTAHYAGNGTYGNSDSSPIAVTVNAESSQTQVRLAAYTSDCSGNVTYFTSVQYGYGVECSGSFYPYWLRLDVTNSSGNLCYNASNGVPAYQCPTGQVSVTNNGGPIIDLGAPVDNSPGTYTLNSQGTAEDFFVQLPGGSDALLATYSPHPIAPNNSYNTSQGSATITVSQAATATNISASQTTVNSGSPVTLTALVCTTSLGLAPSGQVQFANSGNPISGTVTYTGVNAPSPACPPVFASYTAVLTTSFTANASVTAQYVGDTNYTGSTSPALAVTISSGTPSFSMGASPSSFAIAAPGQSGQTTISATALNGFTGTVTFTCAIPAAMTYSTCSFVPTSVTVTSTSTSGSTIITVNTTAPSTALLRFNRPGGWFIPSAGALFACILLLLLMPGEKRRAKLAFGLLVFALLAAGMVACGGGGGTTITTSGGTPTGNYTITVTGTSSTLSQSVNIVVDVE
jgi:hypothetical protein